MASGMFSRTGDGLQKPVTQMDTLAVSMTVGDALLVDDIASPFLVQSLFLPFDDQGELMITDKPDTTLYQYMAHVRNINTTGVALAGVEDTGVFSMVVSPRCGMLDNTKPSPVAVHLVSIEEIEDMTFPIT
ncbi:hypothetical protein BDR22DRAFT_963171 [Usnea florida]